MQLEKLELQSLLAELPTRAPNSHKGTYGHVLIVGGDYNYPGAPVLAALGALRSGAGLVTIATHKEHLDGLNAVHPEIMHCVIDDPNDLNKLNHQPTVIVLGPGLGRSEWSQQVYEICARMEQPQIIDADGLYFLANTQNNSTPKILTPHPGEAKNLLHTQKNIAESERQQAITKLVEKYNCTVVLKGANTLVNSPNTTISICPAGNPGMASGGMGDLLSGVIAGILAQNVSLSLASKLGVLVHALAGDQAAKQGQRGIIATDLLPYIQQIIGS